MIKINITSEPPDKWKKKASDALDEYKQNLQNDPKFKSGIWRELKSFLANTHNHKCCYCEVKRRDSHESDVEHYRPKKSPTENPNHTGYWWLAYEWRNYLYSCKNCNEEHKKTYFPLGEGCTHCNKSSIYHTEADKKKYLTQLNDREKPLLINPAYDNPADFFTFEDSVTGRVSILPKSCGDLDSFGCDIIHIRAKTTIEKTGLNSKLLKESRFELFDYLNKIAEEMKAYKFIVKTNKNYISDINSLAEKIKEETSSSKEFAGYRRYFFTKMGLSEYINND